MAAARVFAIPELLENILINCEPLHLFKIRRVNSAFTAVINRSQHLRRLMGLESGAENPRKVVDHILHHLGHGTTAHPFRIHTNDLEFLLPGFDFELRCDFTEQHKGARVGGLFDLPTGNEGCGSWGAVQIGFPDNELETYITCERMIMTESVPLMGNPTFSDLVKQGFKKAQDNWDDISRSHGQCKY